MAIVDLVKVRTQTLGSGTTMVLGSAMLGFRGTEALEDGANYDYAIVQPTGGYELGTGTYNALAGTLSRDPIHTSVTLNGRIALYGQAVVVFTILAEHLQSSIQPATVRNLAFASSNKSVFQTDDRGVVRLDATTGPMTLPNNAVVFDGSSMAPPITVTFRKIDDSLNAAQVVNGDGDVVAVLSTQGQSMVIGYDGIDVYEVSNAG